MPTPTIEERVDAALAMVRNEVVRAMKKHGPMHSSHEAFGVIFEEFNIEFAEAMKANNAGEQLTEMTQCAAMCVRAMVDVYFVGQGVAEHS